MSDSITKIMARFDALEAKIDKLAAARPAAQSASSCGVVASDADLDGEHGDPEIRKDFPSLIKAGHAPHVGKRYSQAQPAYLDALAELLEYLAGEKDKSLGADDPRRKYIAYDRRDASRARGWSLRLRSGWKPTKAAGGADFGGDDDIPF